MPGMQHANHSWLQTVELGVPYDLAGFYADCDDLQFAVAVVPSRDDVRALTEQFYQVWHSPPDWWAPGGGHEDPQPWGVPEGERASTVCELSGDLVRMLDPVARAKMAQFAPESAAELGVFGCDDYLDAPAYAWGHPGDAQALLEMDLYCGEGEGWEGEDVPGWAESTYFLSRIAGHSPAESLRRTRASLKMFAPERVERLSEPDLDLFNQLEKNWRAFAKAMRAA